ncbi:MULTISPECIES: RcnB family protein [unclassified Pseudomonas]|uniref:RcnB family protein n=1 Tax=unclassified Pseudomonas TaxID=196821 RepID=UPI000BCB4970|nr:MULTISPECIES: RcnB family protein [unclassified Pseudomonas]PVZ19993.1 nickel/cobalt transporter regulator [Pseudomonas sp. URIL14HWK12:I12]PVZ27059.1 nickel/cobalt transporter regulator [Pseudomonas sp. URIL14HWK12:I10]PVZ37948.1 nickel/cobalt transporter regulator [Pseudomonas sp. URIL14HWK12:I11]SNZ05026.1 Nickel/cobalt transporter regulator [Pseudomonas sp. URIL14HWK12:I9]
MNRTPLMASLALLGCLASAPAPAQPVLIERSPPVQVGDQAPDKFLKPEMAVRDWQQRSLPNPGFGTQWVQIDDQVVRVDRTSGTVVEVRAQVN